VLRDLDEPGTGGRYGGRSVGRSTTKFNEDRGPSISKCDSKTMALSCCEITGKQSLREDNDMRRLTGNIRYRLATVRRPLVATISIAFSDLSPVVHASHSVFEGMVCWRIGFGR
jgi:hypothetical protein